MFSHWLPVPTILENALKEPIILVLAPRILFLAPIHPKTRISTQYTAQDGLHSGIDLACQLALFDLFLEDPASCAD